jgi:sulfatase modifying factor 1
MGAEPLRRPFRRLLPQAFLPVLILAAEPPEMVKIPGGDCPIGPTISHVGPEEGDHHDKIPEFLISKYPITNQQYKDFVDASGHAPPDASFGTKQRLWNGATFPPEIARQPVVNVSWQDVVDYCAWLSKREGKPYRLPTEEEWELAARGGLKGKPYPWGDKIDKESAWYGQKWKGPATLRDVDYGKPNAYGLYGMAGNVWQWTATWYAPEYNGRVVQEELHLYRIIRGGSWANEETFAAVNYRNFNPPDVREVYIGFRVAANGSR